MPKGSKHKLPDPKIWKWCKHPECQEKAKESWFFGTGDYEDQKLMRQHSHLCAIYLEEFCAKHMSEEARERYTEKIQTWVEVGNSIEGGNFEFAPLSGIDLQGVTLGDANFNNAFLSTANLQGASLIQTHLRRAHLSKTNFTNAWFWEANLEEAQLQESNFEGASLLWTKLHGAFLEGVRLKNSVNLNSNQIERVGEERKGNWRVAREVYCLLKNYFHQQGRYEDEGRFHYREKLMAKHQAYVELFNGRLRMGFKIPKGSWFKFYVGLVRGTKRTFQNLGKFFIPNDNQGVRRRWFGHWFMWALTGFGEKWQRTIWWATGSFLFFGLLHWLGTNLGWWTLLTQTSQNKIIGTKHLLNCLYFSLVTFVTLGFGDIWPDAWVAKILVGAEVVLGYVFLGLIVVLIARKFGR